MSLAIVLKFVETDYFWESINVMMEISKTEMDEAHPVKLSLDLHEIKPTDGKLSSQLQ